MPFSTPCRLLLQMITRAGELHQMLILANNIPGGSGDVLEVGCGKIHGGISGQVMFWRWGVGRFMEGYLVYLALYPWMSSKWGLWTAHVFQALCLRHGACKSAVSSFHSCRAMPLALGFSALTWSHSKRSMSLPWRLQVCGCQLSLLVSMPLAWCFRTFTWPLSLQALYVFGMALST